MSLSRLTADGAVNYNSVKALVTFVQYELSGTFERDSEGMTKTIVFATRDVLIITTVATFGSPLMTATLLPGR